jgi:hypothetical protein
LLFSRRNSGQRPSSCARFPLGDRWLQKEPHRAHGRTPPFQIILTPMNGKRTERAYAQWVYRFVVHHGRRHPREMGACDPGVPYLVGSPDAPQIQAKAAERELAPKRDWYTTHPALKRWPAACRLETQSPARGLPRVRMLSPKARNSAEVRTSALSASTCTSVDPARIETGLLVLLRNVLRTKACRAPHLGIQKSGRLGVSRRAASSRGRSPPRAAPGSRLPRRPRRAHRSPPSPPRRGATRPGRHPPPRG